MRWLGAVALFAFALGMASAACVPAQSASAPEGRSTAPYDAAPRKRISAAVVGDPPGLNKLRTNPSRTIGHLPGMDELHDLVHVGLTYTGNDGVLRPLLAESVPSVENNRWKVSPDGRMETTWSIRSGAAWHDGTPFTVDDLLFTLRIEQDKDLPIYHSASLDLIADARALDHSTLAIWWSAPFIEANTIFTAALAIPAPKHLLEKPYVDDKATLMELPYWSETFVGTGPFKVREWASGSHVLLEANDRFVLGRPRIDDVEIKFIPDINTLIANILAGTVELTLGRGIDMEQALPMRDQRRDLKVIFSSGSWAQVYPQFVNPNPLVVADVRFRRGLVHAIDRHELTDIFTHGLSLPAHSIVHPSRPEHREIEQSIVRYEFDPRRATQAIEEVGYVRGGDGGLRDATSQRLSVELRTIFIQERQRATLAVAEYWQRVGVAVDPVVIPPQRATDREYRASFPAFELVGARNDLASVRIKLFHSSLAPLPENRFQANGNNARYSNPTFDALVDRYITTIPRQERVQVLARIVQHQTEHVTLMGLFYSLSPTVMSARLENVSRGEDNHVAWNAHEWDLKD